MNSKWTEPDKKEDIMQLADRITEHTNIKLNLMIKWLGISSSKYYLWRSQISVFIKNNHRKAVIPKSHWLLDWEKDAIIQYAKKHHGEGYRRLTYMMIDENIVCTSPSSVYRVLNKAGLLNKWNNVHTRAKGKGFSQPQKFNEHWHTDIKYVNFKGTFLFLISVIDGYSRYIIHHDLRTHMQEFDVQLVIQAALEKYSDVQPRLITDNGPQYISKDFSHFLKSAGLQHIRTSIMYPQSNGKIERFHRTIQSECISKRSLVNLDDAKFQISEYVNFYNSQRLHSSLFYLTPEDFMMNRVDDKLKVRQNKLLAAKNNRFLYRNVS